jgi:hypothetical protein
MLLQKDNCKMLPEGSRYNGIKKEQRHKACLRQPGRCYKKELTA